MDKTLRQHRDTPVERARPHPRGKANLRRGSGCASQYVARVEPHFGQGWCTGVMLKLREADKNRKEAGRIACAGISNPRGEGEKKGQGPPKGGGEVFSLTVLSKYSKTATSFQPPPAPPGSRRTEISYRTSTLMHSSICANHAGTWANLMRSW